MSFHSHHQKLLQIVSTLLVLATALVNGDTANPKLLIGLSEPTISLFQSIRYSTKIRAIREGWSGPVTLSYSGLPAGMKGNFGSASDTQITLPAAQSDADLDLEVGSAVPPGVWPITITATGGPLRATETIQLVIRAPIFKGPANLQYTNFWDGDPKGKTTWAMSTNYTITVDYSVSPATLRLQGQREAVATGPANSSSQYLDQTVGISSTFPQVNATIILGTPFAHERATLTGQISGNLLLLQMSVAYVRENGGGGTLAPWPVFTTRTEKPNLFRKSSPPGSGVITASVESTNGYTPGSMVSIRAVPETGKIFTGWSGDATGTTNPIQITMSANKVVTAAFTDAVAPQAITFAAPWDRVATSPSFQISATASSSLPVSFALVSGPATLSGNTVTLSGASGTVTLRASQGGNASYAPALPVDRSFTVATSGVLMANWAATSGLTGANAGPTATPYNDGTNNLLKYAFNMNAGAPDVRVLAAGGSAGLPRVTLEESGSQPVLKVAYLRRIGSGLIYTPQRSDTLGSFTPMTGTQTITPINAQWELVSVVEPAAMSTSPRSFARIQVSLP